MKKKIGVIAILLVAATLTLGIKGCDKPIQNQARDGIAAAKGFIEDQQKQHLSVCKPELGGDPSKDVCVNINKAIAAKELAIDTLEAYCGSAAFNDNNGPCEPHAELASKLQAALLNLKSITDQLKLLKSDLRGGVPIAALALSESAFLTLLDTVLGILGMLLTSLTGNPLFAGIAQSLEAAIANIQAVKDEVVTKAELEALRTKPLW